MKKTLIAMLVCMAPLTSTAQCLWTDADALCESLTAFSQPLSQPFPSLDAATSLSVEEESALRERLSAVFDALSQNINAQTSDLQNFMPRLRLLGATILRRAGDQIIATWPDARIVANQNESQTDTPAWELPIENLSAIIIPGDNYIDMNWQVPTSLTFPPNADAAEQITLNLDQPVMQVRWNEELENFTNSVVSIEKISFSSPEMLDKIAISLGPINGHSVTLPDADNDKWQTRATMLMENWLIDAPEITFNIGALEVDTAANGNGWGDFVSLNQVAQRLTQTQQRAWADPTDYMLSLDTDPDALVDTYYSLLSMLGDINLKYALRDISFAEKGGFQPTEVNIAALTLAMNGQGPAHGDETPQMSGGLSGQGIQLQIPEVGPVSIGELSYTGNMSADLVTPLLPLAKHLVQALPNLGDSDDEELIQHVAKALPELVQNLQIAGEHFSISDVNANVMGTPLHLEHIKYDQTLSRKDSALLNYLFDVDINLKESIPADSPMLAMVGMPAALLLESAHIGVELANLPLDKFAGWASEQIISDLGNTDTAGESDSSSELDSYDYDYLAQECVEADNDNHESCLKLKTFIAQNSDTDTDADTATDAPSQPQEFSEALVKQWLEEAGTHVVIKPSSVVLKEARADLEAIVKLDTTAAFDVTADGTLKITNLDLINKEASALSPAIAPGISLLTAMSERKKEDGKEVDYFNLTLDAEGTMKLNGKDMSPLLGAL